MTDNDPQIMMNDPVLMQQLQDSLPRRRGRPPKPQERHERELRITPPEGVPIREWNVAPLTEVSKCVAMEEGGLGTGKQLHYHVVIESIYSDEMIKSWIRKLLNFTGYSLGNQIYRSAKPHEGTFGYIVKEETCVALWGYTDEQYNKWCDDSTAYRIRIATERRDSQRLRSQNRKKQLLTIYDKVKDAIERQRITAYPDPITKLYLTLCREANIDFPTKTQMENMINSLRWEYNDDGKDAVVSYYTRNFNLREYT